MQHDRVPSSHGSLGEEGGDAATRGVDAADLADPGSDGFDSEEFREFLRQRNERRGGTHNGGGARRGLRQGRRRDDDDSDDDRHGGTGGKGAGGQPPEWDGSTSFQDWLIKAKLWLATTRARPRTQGPLILQRLSGPAFQAFKHWARDADWLQDDRGGFKLLDAMNSPDQFGEDKEEDLLASLAKITYHLRRGKDEGLRTFFARWDESLRKVREHSVVLPDKYLGFLLINALNLSDQEIKGMLTFTRGSIIPSEVKSWARKHEMKLNAKDIGVEKERRSTTGVSKGGSNVHYMAEEDDADEEVLMMEEALQELRDEDGFEEDAPEADGSILDEHEVAEILNTMVHKKRTFMQSLKTKKAKELSRGYGNWKGGKGNAASGSGKSNSFQASGRLKAGFYKMSLEEMKANSRCSKCLQVGHWHKDAVCPKNQRGKETHYIEKNDEKEVNNVELDEAIFCGWMEEDETAPREDETALCEVMSPDTQHENLAFCWDDEPVVEDKPVVFGNGAELTPDQPVVSSKMKSYDVYSEGDYKTGYRSNSGCDNFQGHHEGFVDFCLSPGEKEILWGKTEGNVRQPETTNDLLCGTIDTGCQRMAIGSETLRQLSLLLPPGLKVGTLKQEFQFRSVHGRSKTSQVATIPTSLGTNGSILKPAIFTGENSENAPFLISLPFLLSCRTVLHLDPSCGLRAEFKKLGFSVKCHIGPSGALRIPLGEFNQHQKMKVASMMKKIRNESSEFEILKTSTSESRTGPDLSSDGPCEVSPERVGRDDVQRQQWRQEEPNSRAGDEGEHPGMGAHRGKAALPDVPDDWTSTQPLGAQDAEGGPQSGRQTQLDPKGLSGHGPGGRGIGSRDGQLRDDRVRDTNVTSIDVGKRTSGSSNSKPDVVTTDFGRSIPGGGTDPDLRRTTSMQSQSAMQAVHVPQTGRQSTSDVLAMSRAQSTSMQDFPMDEVPTSLAGRLLQFPVGDSQHDGFTRTTPSCEDESRGERIGNMCPSDHHPCGNQCPCPEGEVQTLQQALGGPQEDARRDEGRQEGGLRGRGDGEERAGHGRVCGVQEVPGMATDARSRTREQESELQEEDLAEIRSLLLERPKAQKRMERVVRQASTALEDAKAMWHEVMSLLSVHAQSVEQTGWDRWSAAVVSNSKTGQIKHSRSAQKYQNLYGLDAKQMKTVAEVYNPNRFREETKRQGLIHGSAFDLELGHDLLDSETQNEVETYIQKVKPGLVIISPICTLWSLMQNMNRKHLDDPVKMKNYLRRLREAKELLRFGVNVAKVVREYGGVFLIEQPLTSKAWQCEELYRLLQESDIYMARGDQCMYGLVDLQGKQQLKPTGWCSNSEILLQHLDRRCDHQHEHSQILGNEQGQPRSRRAQVYPAQLIQAIIAGYKKHIKDEFLYVEFTNINHLAEDLHRRKRLASELHHRDGETEVLAVNAEAEGDIVEHEAMEDEAEKYQWMPRERPFSLKSLVKRAHDGLGHPSNERLARILKGARASEEAITMAKNLECECCRRHQLTKAPRAAAPPRHYHVNQVVGVDTVWLPTPFKKQRMALNIVCWASRFQMVVPLRNHTPAEARRAYLQWVRFFGPPERLYVDLGKEFRGAFQLGAEVDSTYIEPGALETPTQRSITERAGKHFKEILSKAMMDYACQSETEWNNLVDVTTMVCNRLINKSGFSPVQRVLGYTPRVPGGLQTGGYNDWSTVEQLRAGDLQVQMAEKMRLSATKAFYEADCSQSIRNAVHAGARPVREFEVGQMVYFWRKGTDGVKKNNQSYWRGPARVILTSPPSAIWITYRGYVIKSSPEHLRSATTEETFTLSQWIDDIAQTRADIQKEPRQGYIDLTDTPIPEEIQHYTKERLGIMAEGDETRLEPKHRLGKKTKAENVEGRKEDEWRYNPASKELVRIHHQPRRRLFDPREAPHDCPVDISKLEDWRHTILHHCHDGSTREVCGGGWREGLFSNSDYEPWIGQTKFTLQEETGVREKRGPDIEQEEKAITMSKYRRTEESPDHEEAPEERRSSGTETVHDDPELGRERDDKIDEVMRETEKRGVEEVEKVEDEDDEHPTKRLRIDLIEILLQSVEKAMAAKLKKEVSYKNLDETARILFKKAIEKEIKNNIETGAYVVLSPTESERIRREKEDKIVKSRYVLTEKGIEEEDVDKARCEGVLMVDDGPSSKKAKARHVMKGFSEENSEYLEVTTPQVARDSVMLTLQLLCSRRWKPGYLDFTQAFHSGDPIDREIYAEQPVEGIPGLQARQLLKLKKCCYGLLDGPFQWYTHLTRVLTKELGYECSEGDPCVFYLFDQQRRLTGIISVATDDLLHGGEAEHWNKMEKLNQSYKLGKFTSGNGRFVGKEVTCLDDGSFLVNQPLYTQEKVNQIPITRERAKQKMSKCTEKEITQLRGLLGSLAWLSKETRPDLAGRVALLQQEFPEPYIQSILDGNALAREALKHKEVGVRIWPIRPEHLRIGTVTDASWGNVRGPVREGDHDYWLETKKEWIRIHRQPRHLTFHPAGEVGGPDLYSIQQERKTIWMTEDHEENEHVDTWNHGKQLARLGSSTWTGRTIFLKKEKEVIRVNEKFLQQQRLGSQGGHLLFFYDSRMETEEKAFPVSLISWKSYKLKRCTVNTLSAECQAMIQGVGALHWMRFLMAESTGERLRLDTWEDVVGKIPYIAVTDSKSLYDAITKCRNTASHIEDKRTAIDITILKGDFRRTKGQVRWVEGSRMLSDSLTKKMNPSYLRKILTDGNWSLSEKGFLMQESSEGWFAANREGSMWICISLGGRNHQLVFKPCTINDRECGGPNAGLGVIAKKALDAVLPSSMIYV